MPCHTIFVRFGSQVNDKNKKVKEKCVIAKVTLVLLFLLTMLTVTHQS